MSETQDMVTPEYGMLVIADWSDGRRPAWYDERAGWVRIENEPHGGASGHLPRLSWHQPAPLTWFSIERANKPGEFECAARAQGTAGGNDPADCGWPVCGCDPYTDKVIEALQESGLLKERGAP